MIGDNPLTCLRAALVSLLGSAFRTFACPCFQRRTLQRRWGGQRWKALCRGGGRKRGVDQEQGQVGLPVASQRLGF